MMKQSKSGNHDAKASSKIQSAYLLLAGFRMRCRLLIPIIIVLFLIGCGDTGNGDDDQATGDANGVDCTQIEQPIIDRNDYIPSDSVKMTPATDPTPPVLHLTDEYDPPVPLDSTINTAGGEDSAYFAADADTLYFFFTPDVDVPVEEQVTDPSTGIYRSVRNGNGWREPEKVWVFDIVSLEGCACVQGNTIWYCAAVCGMTGLHHFYSIYEHGAWTNGELDEVLNHPDYQIGEFHITADGGAIYYHSDRTDGVGGRDLWLIEKSDDQWGPPINLTTLNSGYDEGYPFVTADGKELWFTGDSRIDNVPPLGTPDYFGAIFRSQKIGDNWGPPVEVVSQLAGEPTVDTEGNVYFTHHYYVDDRMIEADIYVIRPR
jgi:hypothetical protein